MINFFRLKRALSLCLVVLMIAVVTAGFTGCKEPLESLIQYRRNYCDKTSTSLVKELAIEAIRTAHPGYPEKGICTTLGLKRLRAAERIRQAIIAEQYGLDREDD